MTHPSLQSRVRHLDNARHCGPARPVTDILWLTMHCTGSGRMRTARDVIAWMNKPVDPRGINGPKGPISYGYVIDRDGTIYRMTKPERVAYHAGDSRFPDPIRATRDNPKPHGGASINRKSLGIAWANDNLSERLTALQVESGLWLCHHWLNRLGLPVSNVIGHNECSPGRKVDPARAMPMGDWREMLAE